MNNIVISGTGVYIPPESITNDELVQSFNQYVDEFNKQHPLKSEPLLHSSAEFIEKASGILKRHVVNKTGILDINTMRPMIPEKPDEAHSLQCEMAIEASKLAFENAVLSSQDIDCVIVACSNLQRPYPAIAIEVQNALGIEGYAFDMNVACSSATFGIQTAVNAIQNGSAKAVLMVNPEICTAHLNFRDRDSHFIFGDACTAVILQKAEKTRSKHSFEIINCRLKTQFSNNIRNNFGFLNPSDPSNRDNPDKQFVQQGRKVFKEVVPMVTDFLIQHLKDQNIGTSELKRLWLHQANGNMNRLIAEKVLEREPSPQESPTILHEYGNTSSPGSIIAFHQYHEDLQSGDLGLICSFGAGYSVGSVILKKV